MTTRPAAPDPQHDRHVAFPDDAPPPSLPPTAWAPDPATRVSGPPRRRSNAGWWVVAAFFALPMLGNAMDRNAVMSDGSGGMGTGWRQAAEHGATDLEVRMLEGRVVAGVEPLGPTYAVPSGTTTFRVEVAGADPRGSLQVIGANGDVPVDEHALPFAVEVETDDAEAFQWVVARSAYPDRMIQCRIYAGEDLVAIETGHGVTECTLPSS
ncbi:MAG TPA: hypothetical protein VFY88_12660 [Intrasporangium sp.]|nr:hypothetical protein [Intrasporangium sp.]